MQMFRCSRCGYQWLGRQLDANGKFVKPKRCPPPKGCGSPYWDKPKMTKKARADAARERTADWWAAQKK